MNTCRYLSLRYLVFLIYSSLIMPVAALADPFKATHNPVDLTTRNYPTPPARTDLPWKERTWEDRVYNRTYEDKYTAKHGGVHLLDEWVWGYSQAFAERFRMPKKWVEPKLKGALALAFRMTSTGSHTMCGYGGRAESCWPALECQLDIYYDNRIKLPWNYPEVIRDNLMQNLHSGSFLYDPTYRSRGVARYFYGQIDGLDPNTDQSIDLISSGGNFQFGKFNQGGALLALFDREYFPGVGLISWLGMGVCPKYTGKEQTFITFTNIMDERKYSRGQIKKKDIRIEHRIDIPTTFIIRANAVYEKQNKANDDFTKQLINNFFDSRR